MDFFFRAYASPLLGLVTLGVTFLFYFGRLRIKGGIPSGLIILVTGTGLAWMLHFVQGAQVVRSETSLMPASLSIRQFLCWAIWSLRSRCFPCFCL
jgi:hypothetical protein